MKTIHIIIASLPLTILAACGGSDEKTTVIEKQPIIVQQPAAQPVIVHDHDGY